MMKRKGIMLPCVVVASAALAVGCSVDETHRDFAVPNKLCGVLVPSRALSRLLPPSGDTLTVKQQGSLDDSKLCNVYIDKHRVLVVNNERIDAGGAAHNILTSRLSVGKYKTLEGGGIAYVNWASVSLLKCRGKKIEKEDISTLIEVLKHGRANESAMRELSAGYADALNERNPCRAAL